MAAVLDFPTETDKATPVPQFYYVQDSRHYFGNIVLWWREGGNGYTTNLAEAMRVTSDWVGRPTDIRWPVHEIDARATRRFDVRDFRDIRGPND